MTAIAQTQSPDDFSFKLQNEKKLIHEKEVKKTAQVKGIKYDTFNTFDLEDQRLKKNNKAPLHILQTTPVLANTQTVFNPLVSNSQKPPHTNSIETTTSPQTVERKSQYEVFQRQNALSATNTEIIKANKKTEIDLFDKESDSDVMIEKEVFEQLNTLRKSKYESAESTYKEVALRQKQRKALFEEQKVIKDYLAKRAKVSKVLDWVGFGATGSVIAFSVIGFAATLATGGLAGIIMGPIAGVMTAAAGTTEGVLKATNGILHLQNKEKEGIVKECTELRSIEADKIQSLLSDNQITLKKIHELWKLAVDIIRHRTQLKMF